VRVVNRGKVIIRGLKFERVLGHLFGVIIVSIHCWVINGGGVII